MVDSPKQDYGRFISCVRCRRVLLWVCESCIRCCSSLFYSLALMNDSFRFTFHRKVHLSEYIHSISEWNESGAQKKIVFSVFSRANRKWMWNKIHRENEKKKTNHSHLIPVNNSSGKFHIRPTDIEIHCKHHIHLRNAFMFYISFVWMHFNENCVVMISCGVHTYTLCDLDSILGIFHLSERQWKYSNFWEWLQR